MATLVEFRAQYPQYNDMPDVALANALHEKFYADIPKADFYKSVALNPAVFIPDNQNMITLPKAERSMQDTLMGYVETPAIIAGNIGRAITAPIAKYGTEALVGWNTPQGMQAGQKAAQTVSNQFYQPRTETGPEVAGAIGEALGSIPPTPLTSAGTALSTLMPTATNQLRNIVVPATRQATAPVTNVLANAMQRQQAPAMQGMGAAQTSEQLMREERLQRLGIPATTGERTKSLAQQQFEADVARGVVTGIGEEEKTKLAERMRAFKTNQKQAIVNNFERMTQDVGAEVADPTQMRQVGRIVDKAVNDAYTKKYDNYKALYQKADQAGETLQEVPYQSLLDYINTKTPTAREKLDPILNSVAESLAMNDPTKSGKISIRALEDIYQEVGQVKNSPNAGELKKRITNMGEGAGGELYQAARTARSQLAKEFEDVSRVDKLLGTKAGYTDRRVALDDVFKHVVLDGSLEEMRTVTSLLKKAGPQGQQAYAELQGQTIQHMKDLLTKGDQLSFKNLNTLVTQLDSEDKLAYMFGKPGRDQIMDLRDAIKDVVVKEPGAVNFPNTAGAVLRGLEALQAVRVPGAKSLAEMARTSEVTKKVESALKQPNKLAPSQSSRNSLAP
jgi:hypothetical protein